MPKCLVLWNDLRNAFQQRVAICLSRSKWSPLAKVSPGMFWSAVLMAFASLLFVNAVWVRPALRLPAMVRELKGRLKAEANKPPVPDTKAESWQRYYEESRAGQERLARLGSQIARGEGRNVRLGFYVD
jgi:hypothetical protein